ncbi:unnamed protein product [Peniophora sp. CBMAI 1063]|nr:unnamed protein product [Peniophora sp. CBMAI 1063]
MSNGVGAPTIYRPSILLRHGELVNGVKYGRELQFIIAQKTCAPAINYIADVAEDVFFDTMARQSMPLLRSNWSLLDAGFSRAFVFHLAVVTNAAPIVLLVVLVYLDRMRGRLVIPPACLGYGLITERLLLGAWMLAFQRLYGSIDNHLATWAEATRQFTPPEVEQTLREIRTVLEDDLSFTEIDMRVHCRKMAGFYETWTESSPYSGNQPLEPEVGGRTVNDKPL